MCFLSTVMSPLNFCNKHLRSYGNSKSLMAVVVGVLKPLNHMCLFVQFLPSFIKGCCACSRGHSLTHSYMCVLFVSRLWWRKVRRWTVIWRSVRAESLASFQPICCRRSEQHLIRATHLQNSNNTSSVNMACSLCGGIHVHRSSYRRPDLCLGIFFKPCDPHSPFILKLT